MKKTAAITICSLNYFTKAFVLYESYVKHHPTHEFYILIVDRKDPLINIEKWGMNILWVEDLGIVNFEQYAFMYDVIELNTNVKPIAMSLLLKQYDNVLYLDPDIKIFSPLEPVFSALKYSSVVVTPHYINPIMDGNKPDDIELMKFGIFNLGFVGVSRSEESHKFLAWWSERCLKYGFYEPQSGLAVDQKWISLAPGFFPNLTILFDKGLNVAFWNLHERVISQEGEDAPYYVNNEVPLRFVHFSSFNPRQPEMVAGKQSRFSLGSRPDFELVARPYAEQLIKAEALSFSKQLYSFDFFDDGTYITPALRRFFSARFDEFQEENKPFSSKKLKAFARKNNLLSKSNLPSKRANFQDIAKHQTSIKIISWLLRRALMILGPDRYFNLMRYAAHISSLRHQREVVHSTPTQDESC
jgi:hypothetical protein